SDLDVKLISPSGAVIDLFAGVGGGGQDFANTCVQDGTPQSIAQGSAPFSGTYRPMGTLGDANSGADGNGTWTLRILDTYAFADAGTVLQWSLTFGPNAGGPFVLEGSNLPLVLVDTYDQEIPDGAKIPAWMSIIHNGPAALNDASDAPNVYNGNIGIQRRGNFSNILPQKPYNVETRFADGTNLNVSLLGMPSENDWILRANYNDKSLMRDAMAYGLFRSMGHYAPRTRTTELLLNGSYRGIYSLTESIKRDNGRVDIATLNPTENSGDDVTGGYIIKVDNFDASNSWLLAYSPPDHPSYTVHMVYVYPTPELISDAQKTYIQGFVNGFETALYSGTFEDEQSGYRAWIDTRSFIDYFLVNEVARNVDGFKKSRFFNKDKDSNGGLLKAGPVWDFDWAWMNVQECYFGATDGSGWSHHINDCNLDVRSPGWMIRLLQDSTFANELQCRYQDLRNSVLSTDRIFQFIDSTAAAVAQGQERHFERWPIWGVNSGTPEVWPLAQNYAEEVQRLKDWISLRLVWLDDNMPGSCLTTTAVQESGLPTLRVFPNPTTDVLHVEGDRSIQDITVFDGSGRLLLEVPGTGTFHRRLDLGHLNTGTYWVRVRYVDGVATSKAVAVVR
ncbi:MAG: CotH kinase family protein, partial [Flavobacteriales bacterium]